MIKILKAEVLEALGVSSAWLNGKEYGYPKWNNTSFLILCPYFSFRHYPPLFHCLAPFTEQEADGTVGVLDECHRRTGFI